MENREEVLTGTAGRILSGKNPGSITFLLDTGEESVCVLWSLGEVKTGMRLELAGYYLPENADGKRFMAERRRLIPNADDVRLMLEDDAVESLSELQAVRIAEAFGESALDIMRNEPEKLAKTTGIPLKSAKKIAKELSTVPEDSVKYFLMRHYVWKSKFQFEDALKDVEEPLKLLEQDPYYLCDIEGSGFSWPDGELLAGRLALPKQHPSCVRASLRRLLQEAAVRDGQACLPYRDLLLDCRKKYDLIEADVDAGYRHAIGSRTIYGYDSGQNGKYVYLPVYYEAEQYIAARVQAVELLPALPEESVEDEIRELEAVFRMEYAPEQRDAIQLSRTARMMILTGGPGTGKTTVLNAMIMLAERRDEKILLAAPTGLAAKHMAAAAGRDAKTVHRLLGAKREEEDEEFSFSRNEENPLQADLVIVDEASMLDTVLFASLLRACSMETRLIFIGDVDQLPPVGTGTVLQSLLESGKIPAVRLQQVQRQAEGSLIVQNAHRILRGEQPLLTVKDSDFFFFDRRNKEDAEKLLSELYTTRLPNYGFSPSDIQVLTPMRHDANGGIDAEHLNELLQELVNPILPGEAALHNKLYTFHAGDRVMQIWNDYSLEWRCGDEEGQGIFNGDTGTVQDIVRGEKDVFLRVDFDGHIVNYPKKLLANLALAYAVTVHKSQGSEYPCVVLVLRENTGRWDPLAYRSLLYTAITRAKSLLVIIGDPNKLMQMARSFSKNKRYSCLRDMILAVPGDALPAVGIDADVEAFLAATEGIDIGRQESAPSVDLDDLFSRLEDE